MEVGILKVLKALSDGTHTIRRLKQHKDGDSIICVRQGLGEDITPVCCVVIPSDFLKDGGSTSYAEIANNNIKWIVDHKSPLFEFTKLDAQDQQAVMQVLTDVAESNTTCRGYPSYIMNLALKLVFI